MGAPESGLRCFACGRRAGEVAPDEGPSAEQAGQTHRWAFGVLEVHAAGGPCRAAVACWPCFWKADPDQWIPPEAWASLSPLVPFERLPALDHRGAAAWDPASYPWPS